MQATYLAGAFDAYSVLLPEFEKDGVNAAVNHYGACLTNARISVEQLARNLRSFVATRPQLQSGTAATAFSSYMVKLCGPPPKRT
jgi:hypothetical protein